MSFIFGDAKTYSRDLALFENLGLKLFNIDNQEKHFVGEYRFRDYDDVVVKIFVCCRPAQFWFFEINSPENGKFEVSTGSGALGDYWNTVELIATGMLDIKKPL